MHFVALLIDSIDSYYVDGISLTYGRPRKHIWTFASSLEEIGDHLHSNCPCININQAGSASTPPAFVGNDYTSVIQAFKAHFNIFSMVKILCGMELVVGL